MRILSANVDESGMSSFNVEWSDGTSETINYTPWISLDDIKDDLMRRDTLKTKTAAAVAARKEALKAIVDPAKPEEVKSAQAGAAGN